MSQLMPLFDHQRSISNNYQSFSISGVICCAKRHIPSVMEHGISHFPHINLSESHTCFFHRMNRVLCGDFSSTTVPHPTAVK